MMKRLFVMLFPLLLLQFIWLLPAYAASPVAFCPFTGVKDVVIEQDRGGVLQGPNRYENPTDAPWAVTVYAQEQTGLLGLPALIVDPLVLEPHQSYVNISTTLTIPPGTSFGRDRVTLIVVGAAQLPNNVTSHMILARCEYDVTVAPTNDVILVPVRWCALEGSAQAEDKLGPGDNNGQVQVVSGRKLLERVQRVNDEIFFPQTKIAFFQLAVGIPVIDDTDGRVDGILAQGATSLEIVTRQCRQAWDQRAPGLPGTILINTKCISGLTSIGSCGVVEGEAAPNFEFQEFRSTLCRYPASLDIATLHQIQQLAVYDIPGRASGSMSDLIQTLGHELGHTLSLGHGDGLDNDMDGMPAGTPGTRFYDQHCDTDWQTEDRNTTAHSLMDATPSLNFGNTITPLQRETLRSIAKLVPGASYPNVNDPAGSLVAPKRTCEPNCKISSDLFLTEAGVAETPPTATSTLWHSVRGSLPPGATNHHLSFIDLDNATGTGCDPATLFPRHIGFKGAELVSRVTVSNTSGSIRAVPTLWRCEAGRLAKVADPAVQAQVTGFGLAGDNRKASAPPLSVLVALRLPTTLRGPAANQIRMQAIVERAGGDVERLPAAGNGGTFSWIPPTPQPCTLAKPVLAPGARSTVRASKLAPNRPAAVYVGPQLVATGTANESGDLAVEVAIPAGSRQGFRPISVLQRGELQGALCSVLVQGSPVTPFTVAEIVPPPNNAEWNNTDVTVKLTATDVAGGPGIREVTYSANGANTVSNTKITTSPKSIALSTEGKIELSFFATNKGGVAETPQTLTVQIDRTAPTVTFSGNTGSYRITSTVNIACRATDALSGVDTSTCQNVSAPAYTFDAGTTKLSAEAVDYALNRGNATVSFTVRPTYDDLCALTDQLRASRELGNSLCARLQQAQREQAAGRQDKKTERLNGYINTVRQNTPRVFARPNAAILIKFANACVSGSC